MIKLLSRWFNVRDMLAEIFIYKCMQAGMYYVDNKDPKRWYMKILFNPPNAKDNNFCFFRISSVIVMCTTVNDKLSLRENGNE